jgi:hypothetical protein
MNLGYPKTAQDHLRPLCFPITKYYYSMFDHCCMIFRSPRFMKHPYTESSEHWFSTIALDQNIYAGGSSLVILFSILEWMDVGRWLEQFEENLVVDENKDRRGSS